MNYQAIKSQFKSILNMQQNNDFSSTQIARIPENQKITPDYQGSIFAKTQFFGKNKVTVAFDWIEFTAIQNPDKTDFLASDRFQVKFMDHGTQYFIEMAEIFHLPAGSGEWIKCASLEIKPRVNFINQNIVKIKLENRYCYQESPDQFINDLLQDLKLTFKNYTRIDTCCDFQKIATGEMIQDMLLKFSSKKYVMKGKSMQVFHRTKDITGIKFGKRESGCSITMYNKSLEMRTKGDKRHIKELWAAAAFDKDHETYRIEFSEKKNLLNLFDNESGEVQESHCDISYIKNVERNFKYLYKKHFNAAIFCAGVRFSRMEKINILDIEQTAIVSKRLCEKKQANNYIKAHIKRTFEDATAYDLAGDALKASGLYEYIQDELIKFDLHEWFNKKFPMYQIYCGEMTVGDHLSNRKYLSHQFTQSRLNLN